MEIEIRTEKTLEQKAALKYMKKIAEYRDKLAKIDYNRPDKKEEPSKQIFSEFIEKYICEALNLKWAKKGNKGFDAFYKKGRKKIKFEIKEVTHSAAILGKKRKFDYLVAVELDKKDFSIKRVMIFTRSMTKYKQYIGSKNQFKINKIKRLKKYVCFENGEWKTDCNKMISLPFNSGINEISGKNLYVYR